MSQRGSYEYMKESQYNIRQRNREYILDHLYTHPCIDCGITDVRVLEFDHVRGIKFKELSKMMAGHYSIKKIQEEIDKCEVRCCNCHRIVTLERLGIDKF